MKRDALVRSIRRAALRAGRSLALVRQGSEHELWRCGDTLVVIPRHREINELTAGGIRRHLEAELGKAWWR